LPEKKKGCKAELDTPNRWLEWAEGEGSLCVGVERGNGEKLGSPRVGGLKDRRGGGAMAYGTKGAGDMGSEGRPAK